MEQERNIVGILGASGKVGGGAVDTMLAATDFPVVLGGRNLEKLRERYQHAEARIEFMYADVYDSDSLGRFCEQCAIVINCAGPSKQILDRVAAASIRHRAHYVDVSGDEHLYKRLLNRQRDIEEKQLSCIVSAGVYPGLSEIFPAYIAETCFDDVDSLELFFAGNGDFSLHAAYDIVCSIQEDTGLGMAYCKNGETSRIDRPIHRSYRLPSPAGEREAYPILHHEFLAAARAYRFTSALFYNTYEDPSILNKFVMIKALEQYKTEAQKQASARMLVEQFDAHQQQANEYTLFHLLATGCKSGKPLRLASTLLYNKDWNTLSGMVAAHAARLVMEDDKRVPGCYFAMEGICPVKMMNLLGEWKVDLTHTFMEVGQG